MLKHFLFQQPEKKNPGLTPMDWVKFLVSAVVGLVSFMNEVASVDCTLAFNHFVQMHSTCLSLQVAVSGSVEMPKADLWVIFAILSTVVGYCAKTYFTLSLSPSLSIHFLHLFKFLECPYVLIFITLHVANWLCI